MCRPLACKHLFAVTFCGIYCTEPLPAGRSRQRTVCELLLAGVVNCNLAQAIPQQVLLLVQLLLVLLLFDLQGNAADVDSKTALHMPADRGSQKRKGCCST